MIHLTDKDIEKYIKICKDEGITYKTDAEYREAAQNLANYVELAYELAVELKGFDNRLKTEPKGFALAGEGRNCSLCGQSVYGDGWYDKWGFKCMNCQSAIDKNLIPGSLCKDYKDEKYITDTSLAYHTSLHTQTIRKLIRQGKIKARKIPDGPNLILRKDNPKLKLVLEKEKLLQNQKR